MIIWSVWELTQVGNLLRSVYQRPIICRGRDQQVNYRSTQEVRTSIAPTSTGANVQCHISGDITTCWAVIDTCMSCLKSANLDIVSQDPAVGHLICWDEVAHSADRTPKLFSPSLCSVTVSFCGKKNSVSPIPIIYSMKTGGEKWSCTYTKCNIYARHDA